MDQQHSGRHRKLLEYVEHLVAVTCPPYLRNDADDIVQTVMVRLHTHAEGIAQQLEQCSRLLRAQRDEEAATILQSCLREIGKAWHRTRTKRVHRRLETCHAAILRGRFRRESAVAIVDDARSWLVRHEGKKLFSDVYVQQGVHWAFLDAGKKHRTRAEVPAEETDDGSPAWDSPTGDAPDTPGGMVFEVVSHCLRQLRKTWQRATYLSLHGYRQREIAKYLELTIPQAETRVRRGKNSLRECLRRKGVTP